MPIGVDRATTPATRWATCGDDLRSMFTERCRLAARDGDANHAGRVIVEGVVIIVIVRAANLAKLQHHAVAVRVVAEGDAAQDESVANRWCHVHRCGHRAVFGRRQILEHIIEIFRNRSDLRLFAFQVEPAATAADLQEEHPSTRFAHGASGEHIDIVESFVDRVATHDNAKSPIGPPVELMASTAGPCAVHVRAEIEQVEITIRWNKSRCVPTA